MDEERRVSLPEHFDGWDVKRAATFRVLVRLWRFGDYGQSEAWCFRTDAELIEDCGLGGGRQLRMCLRDLREAGLVARETAPDGRRGFRLYNRAPHAEVLPDAVQGRPGKTGKIQPERSNRKDLTGKVSPLNRKGCVPKPERSFRTTLLESRRAEEQSVDPPDLFTLDPAPSAKTPRKRRSKSGLSDEDAGRLFEAQQAARAQVAAKLGKRVGPSSLLPGLRKAMDKAFERIPDVDGLIAAMAYRGRTDKTPQEYQWLGGPSAWNGIDHAYGNRDDTGGPVPVTSDGSLIDTTR